jgi:hypothetical protein
MFDEIKSTLKDFFRRLFHESRRTAILAKLRLELKSLEYKKREANARLGEKLYDLHKRKVVRDEFLSETLFEQFEELEDIEKKAINLLEEIQKVTLMEYEYLKNEEAVKEQSGEGNVSDAVPELIELSSQNTEETQSGTSN